MIMISLCDRFVSFVCLLNKLIVALMNIFLFFFFVPKKKSKTMNYKKYTEKLEKKKIGSIEKPVDNFVSLPCIKCGLTYRRRRRLLFIYSFEICIHFFLYTTYNNTTFIALIYPYILSAFITRTCT